MSSPATPNDSPDVLVVGAGFAGLYLLHRLRGEGWSVQVVEAGAGVGGTWYWNRYPGARCDVESMQYSYSFDEALQQEWHWPERFSAQPDILAYANHVADRFDLRANILFETRVEAARWDAAAARWVTRTDTGRTFSSRFVIMATGCLSSAKMPEIEGIDDFQGQVLHTGLWPHEPVAFDGLHVGVVGTGSSGIQSIPVIAETADRVTVFQRTPNFSIPSRNAPMTADYEGDWKDEYAARRERARVTRNGILQRNNDIPAMSVSAEERAATYEQRWEEGGTYFLAAFGDIGVDEAANESAADFVRAKIRETVKDPATADLLCPTDYPIGTKRICVDTDYFETFNRENVALVDVRANPITRVTSTGLETTAEHHELDMLVFATGFDAMTGAMLAVDIEGRDGARLDEAWAAGPRTLLGFMTAGFPNLFMITGPGSPSVLSNMILSIEQHVDMVSECLANLRHADLETVEADEAAQDDWVAHVNAIAGKTLYPRAASWYMGANVPGKPRIFMPYIGGVGAYRARCEEVMDDGWRGFRFGGAARQAESRRA